MSHLAFLPRLVIWAVALAIIWNYVYERVRGPTSTQKIDDFYFETFKGFQDCGISLQDLYLKPKTDIRGFYAPNTFCTHRVDLLEALSGGGRIGFDAPYQARGCSYRWFTPEEICSILERFDLVAFVGDGDLHKIYGGLNILLRRDLAYGALDTSETSDQACKCDRQFTQNSCLSKFGDGLDGQKHGVNARSLCAHTYQTFLSSQASTAAQHRTVLSLKELISSTPKSNYKPTPIILSWSPYAAEPHEVTGTLKHLADMSDSQERKTPILWIGPAAAGHIDIRGRKGNQEIWDFDRKVAEEARDMGIEVLGMWNMTAMATSWNGKDFGETVAITQAMMVANWLSRLESS